MEGTDAAVLVGQPELELCAQRLAARRPELSPAQCMVYASGLWNSASQLSPIDMADFFARAYDDFQKASHQRND